MIAEILFLLGIEYREGDSKLQCGIVAGLLHYTFLAAFAWMALEGIHLYLSLNQVFNVDNRSVVRQTTLQCYAMIYVTDLLVTKLDITMVLAMRYRFWW